MSTKNAPPIAAHKTTPDEPKTFRFPSAFTVLFGVTIAVWLLAFVIPTGTYQTDGDNGRPIPGTYEATGGPIRRESDLVEAMLERAMAQGAELELVRSEPARAALAEHGPAAALLRF